MPGPIPKVLFSSGLGEPRYQHLTSPTGHSNMPTGVRATAPKENWKAGGGEKGLPFSVRLIFHVAWQHGSNTGVWPRQHQGLQALARASTNYGQGIHSLSGGAVPSSSTTSTCFWELVVSTGVLCQVFTSLTCSEQVIFSKKWHWLLLLHSRNVKPYLPLSLSWPISTHLILSI